MESSVIADTGGQGNAVMTNFEGGARARANVMEDRGDTKGKENVLQL